MIDAILTDLKIIRWSIATKPDRSTITRHDSHRHFNGDIAILTCWRCTKTITGLEEAQGLSPLDNAELVPYSSSYEKHIQPRLRHQSSLRPLSRAGVCQHEYG